MHYQFIDNAFNMRVGVAGEQSKVLKSARDGQENGKPAGSRIRETTRLGGSKHIGIH